MGKEDGDVDPAEYYSLMGGPQRGRGPSMIMTKTAEQCTSPEHCPPPHKYNPGDVPTVRVLARTVFGILCLPLTGQVSFAPRGEGGLEVRGSGGESQEVYEGSIGNTSNYEGEKSGMPRPSHSPT